VRDVKRYVRYVRSGRVTNARRNAAPRCKRYRFAPDNNHLYHFVTSSSKEFAAGSARRHRRICAFRKAKDAAPEQSRAHLDGLEGRPLVSVHFKVQ